MDSKSDLPPSIDNSTLPKDYLESKERLAKDPTQLPWYLNDLENLKPEARELFEKYSKVPADQVVAHIKTSRDKAFQHYPYPCLGRWAFLELSMSGEPQYSEVVQRVQDGQKFLDIGCCVGQDLRKLVYDGASTENCYGSDLEQSFLDIGYELFLDKSTSKITFISANILDADSNLNNLNGRIDIVYAASFLHLFNWEQCMRTCRHIIGLLKAQPGSLFFGRQLGNVEPGELVSRFDPSKSRYKHNGESFKRLWRDLGEETGTTWEVEAGLDPDELGSTSTHEFMKEVIPPGSRWLHFTVRRI